MVYDEREEGADLGSPMGERMDDSEEEEEESGGTTLPGGEPEGDEYE